MQPSYPGVDLTTVRFGLGARQVGSRGITDCSVMFFPNSSWVDKVRFGTLVHPDDDHNLLYHELAHTEQCAVRGGRDPYAVMWWEQLDSAFLSNPDPTTLHDSQPMEAAAASRATESARCSAQGSKISA